MLIQIGSSFFAAEVRMSKAYISSGTEQQLVLEGETLLRCQMKIITPNEEDLSLAVEELGRIDGVDEVSHAAHTQQFYLALDASQTCLHCIGEVLERHHVEIYEGWWKQLLDEYLRLKFRDGRRDSGYMPHCCEEHYNFSSAAIFNI